MAKNFSRIAVVLLALSVAGLAFAGGHKGAEKKLDIVDTAANAGSFNTLVAAVKAAGLVDALKADGPFTVFAPTDEAFAKLPEGTLESLLEPANKQKLVDILTYHVVSGSIYAKDAKPGAEVTTLQGAAAKLSAGSNGLRIGNANIVKTDIKASNGVIHVIDAVILPPAKRSANTAECSSASAE